MGRSETERLKHTVEHTSLAMFGSGVQYRFHAYTVSILLQPFRCICEDVHFDPRIKYETIDTTKGHQSEKNRRVSFNFRH